MRQNILFSLLFFTLSFPIYSTHIIGGDFTVQFVSGNTFEVTLTLFRDCSDISGAPFDELINISVYEDITNTPLSTLNFPMTVGEIIPTPLGDECFTPDICLEIGTYTTTVELPDNPNGYYFSWERCCRNSIISNIENPGDAGMVFLVSIPDPAIENSTPIFTPYPTYGYLCINGSNNIDFSATDVDGDSLVYRLEAPLKGDLSGNPGVGGNPFPDMGGPKPLSEITWLAPFALDNICGGFPTMTIDSQTGILSANPTDQGVFVLAIAVDEYRNGDLISTIRREIQLQSTICTLAIPPQYIGFEPIDTIQVFPLQDNIVGITVQALGSTDLSTSVTGSIITPGFDPIATLDTLTANNDVVDLQFTWDNLPCDMIGNTYLLQFVASAYSTCLDSLLTNTLDLYVEVIAYPESPTFYSSPGTNEYHIIYGEEDTYDFLVAAVDDNSTDTLLLTMNTNINGIHPIEFSSDTAFNLVSSDFRWEVTCDDIREEPYHVTFQTLTTFCNVNDTTLHEMDLYVTLPEPAGQEIIPNVFTPNGDLNNELYEIRNTPEHCVTGYHLTIYNRWGNLVFETEDRDQFWDGKLNGRDVHEGIYYLIVDYLYFGESKKATGQIHLLR